MQCKTTPWSYFSSLSWTLYFFVSDSVLFFYRFPKDSSNSVHIRHKRKAFSLCQVVGSTAYLQQRVLFLQRVQNCFLCTAFNCRLGLVGWRVRHEALTLLHKPSRSKTNVNFLHAAWFSAVTGVKQDKLNVLIPAAGLSIIAATSPLPFSSSACQPSSACKANRCFRAKRWMELVSHSLCVYSISLRVLWKLYFFPYLTANTSSRLNNGSVSPFKCWFFLASKCMCNKGLLTVIKGELCCLGLAVANVSLALLCFLGF